MSELEEMLKVLEVHSKKDSFEKYDLMLDYVQKNITKLPEDYATHLESIMDFAEIEKILGEILYQDDIITEDSVVKLVDIYETKIKLLDKFEKSNYQYIEIYETTADLVNKIKKLDETFNVDFQTEKNIARCQQEIDNYEIMKQILFYTYSAFIGKYGGNPELIDAPNLYINNPTE